jgi:hypothetical protein
MIRKGQVKRLNRNDATGQAKFVESLFQIAAKRKFLKSLLRPELFFATLPA